MILAQTRPDATGAFVVFEAKTLTRLDRVFVSNHTAGAISYSIFIDHGDRETDTLTEATAIAYAVSLAANSTANIEFLTTIQQGVRLGVAASAADSLTFTVFGEEA